jgi:hypothetical protein
MMRYFKDLFFLFLATVIFSISIISNSFAIVDITSEANYSVIGINGNQVFSASMPALKPWPYFETNNDYEGDLSLELGNPFCVAYLGAFAAALYAGSATVKAVAVASLITGSLTVYNVAAIKFQDFEICGANWLVWGNSDINAGSSVKNYYPEQGEFNGSLKREVINCIKDKGNCDSATKNFMGTRTIFDMRDRVFRERVYNGEEIVNNNCKDPRSERSGYDVNGTGQLYYMRGYQTGNYACDRFLVLDEGGNVDAFKDAYDCCVKASRSVCITDKMTSHIGSLDLESRHAKHILCSIDKNLCTYDAFIFQIFDSIENDKGVYCARTWSLCPYNFNIEKGTEKSSYFEKKAVVNKTSGDVVVSDPCFDEKKQEALSCEGKRKNFYQYNRHCTVVEQWVQADDYNDVDYAPFIDRSCINFIGSSHNTTDYKTYNGYKKLFSEYKSFTAPIAECITETLKNFLYNRAGHSKCKVTENLPDIAGKCDNGFEYQEGDDLLASQGIVDPVSKLMGYINKLLMLTLTLMITLYGYGILVNGGKAATKDIIMMIIKVAIVLAFASSIWWRNQLFSFVYGASETFMTITDKIAFDNTQDSESNFVKYDGCFFGNINDVLGSTTDTTPNIQDNNYDKYPASRRYVSMFDSFDCKISKYLGYSVGKNLPNIIYVIGASIIWPFNIGIFLAVASVMMALFVISFAIRATYIFVASTIALAMFLYVSPIIIPCILFKSTKKMFDAWLKNLISFALQPMFLFAYVAVSLSIMDNYVLGEGIFKGSGPQRELVCGYVCKGSDSGEIVSYGDNYSKANCEDNQTTIDLKRKSVLCLLEKATATPFTTFNSIGIFLSFLKDFQLSDLIMFLRIAFLFFILNNAIGTVPGIATNLTGSSSDLPGSSPNADPFVLASKIMGMAVGAAKIFKYGGAGLASGIGKLGKKLKSNDKPKGGDKEDDRK